MDARMKEQIVKIAAMGHVTQYLVACLLRNTWASFPPAEVENVKQGLRKTVRGLTVRGVSPGDSALFGGECEDALEQVFDLIDELH